MTTWYDTPRLDVYLAASGPRPGQVPYGTPRSAGQQPARAPEPSTTVSHIVEHNASISSTSPGRACRTGQHLLLPQLQASGPRALPRQPQLDGVVPTSHHVSLSYGTTPWTTRAGPSPSWTDRPVSWCAARRPVPRCAVPHGAHARLAADMSYLGCSEGAWGASRRRPLRPGPSTTVPVHRRRGRDVHTGPGAVTGRRRNGAGVVAGGSAEPGEDARPPRGVGTRRVC